MSTKYRIRLTYAATGKEAMPPTMIVKGNFGRHANWDWVYETEMISYRDVLPTLDVPAAKAFFAGHEPKTGEAILILEDLDARNVRFNNVHSSLTYQQMQAFMDVLARLHARYWDGREFQDGGFLSWTVPLLSMTRGHYGQVTSPAYWEAYLAMPRGTLLPRALRDGARMLAAIHNLEGFHRASTSCLTHGDCHFGNSYLSADGDPGLVDWQVKHSPWQQDLAYFLVSGLDVADRRRWEQPLLEYYLSRLDRHGATPPNFREAFLFYRAEILYGLVVWITNGDDRSQFQKEPINTGNTARFAMAALDHDSLAILS